VLQWQFKPWDDTWVQISRSTLITHKINVQNKVNVFMPGNKVVCQAYVTQ
jgi:hypothetical protein